jgi:spermidine synthase
MCAGRLPSGKVFCKPSHLPSSPTREPPVAVAVSLTKSPARTSSRRGLVLGLFVASGAAGLIYQVVWSRELVLVFGNTTQAVATIVTAFMAGLGFGSLVGGRRAGRTANPLALYGAVELAVAVYALLLPFAFSSLGDLYRGVYPSLVQHPAGLTAVRLLLALAAVAPATFLMGMTLPLLVRHLVRTLDEAGARLGELYAANTAGAFTGTLLAGFVLIEFLGLRRTSYVAVALNLLAGLGAQFLARRNQGAGSGEGEAGEAASSEPASTQAGGAGLTGLGPARRRLVLAATFVSGFVALALEVLWTRMLAAGTGVSIYIFTTILAVYLLGIALGSAAYRRWTRPGWERLGVLGLCLGAVGLLAQLTVVVGSGVFGNPSFLARSVVILLPATILMGFAFPLAGRLLVPSAERAGASVGLLYAANTAGSILGSFSAAFILAGTLGTNGSVLLLGGLNLLTGAALLLAGSRAEATTGIPGSGRALVGRPLAAALTVLAVAGVVASSLSLPVTRTATENRLRATGLPVTHAEDELATVDTLGGPAAGRRLLVGGVGMTSLTVDTKLMAYLSKALRPQAHDFLVIAFGMGGTFRAGLKAGFQTDAVELSPTVPSRMPVFFPDAQQSLHNPSGHVIVSDGRNYVRLTRKHYDVIAADPPPPVESAGSVVLYTREFLTEGKARLNPGGVFMLWIPYSVPLQDLKTHVRTFHAVFPHVSLLLAPARHGVYMFGSEAPLNFDDQPLLNVLSDPVVRSDLANSPDYPPTDPAGWVRAIHHAEWLADDQVTAFTGPGPLITDDQPRSEYYFWRRRGMADRHYISEAMLRAAAP